MRNLKFVIRSSIVLSATVILLNATPVFADYMGQYTYFENVPRADLMNPDGSFRKSNVDGTITGLISAWHSGNSSTGLNGFVMPNWYSTDTSPTGGGGAVGYSALRAAYTAATGETLNVNNQKSVKQAMYYLLRDRNKNINSGANSPNAAWDKMGSAVVAHTMLGSGWESSTRNRSRTVSDSDWERLYNYLVENDDLEMVYMKTSNEVNSTGVIVRNSAGQLVYDAIRYTYESNIYNVDSWVFRSKSTGTIYYRLEIICANPLGILNGLPPYTPPPPIEYTLTPEVVVPRSTAEPDNSITITNRVTNSGPDASRPTEWRFTRLVYNPGTNPDTSGKTNNLEPCASFSSSGRQTCEAVSGEQRSNVVFQPSGPASRSFFYFVPIYEVGTRICFVASVSTPTHADSPTWRHSAMRCFMIAKSPKMQVWGGDVRVGGNIVTSTRYYTNPSLTMYGSWGEYGALSAGGNSALASGSGLNNGNSSTAQSTWSRLTFANTGGSGSCSFGCYNFDLVSDKVVSQFNEKTVNITSSSLNLNSLSGKDASGNKVVYRRSGSLDLTGTTIDQGKSIIIQATGTVTISGDIRYNDGPYSNIRDIPQVIIQAPTIQIRGGVGQVDAWLFALNGSGGGVLDTCSDRLSGAVRDNLTSTHCNIPLRINGPVVADKLLLRRTAGSDAQVNARGNPAEIFNLRADAYLWGSAYGLDNNRARTVYTRELAPRF